MSSTQTFAGFPKEALLFLSGLAENNNKEWFEAHKAEYQQQIIAHVPAFVATLGERLKSISPEINYDTRTNGSGSMMRIYRDVRFSQDKTPYKTDVGFMFWQGMDKKMANPGFGFQFGHDGAGIYAGLWEFPKEMIDAYRRAVLDDQQGGRLVEAITAVRKAGNYTVHGEHYKRVPTGFDAAHPRADLLKHTGLYALAESIDLGLVTTPELVDVCFEHCRKMAPVEQWVVRFLQGA